MPEYRLTPAAKSDLLEIWNYTLETWGKKQAGLLKFTIPAKPKSKLQKYQLTVIGINYLKKQNNT